MRIWTLLAFGAGSFAALSACGMGHDDDFTGRHEITTGVSQGRQGVGEVRQGLAFCQQGRLDQGVATIREGMNTMHGGRRSMHDGMGMLSNEMRGHCGTGVDHALGVLDDGLARMTTGLELMTDNDEDNDAAGMSQLRVGVESADTALGNMHDSLTCMEHCRGNDMM